MGARGGGGRAQRFKGAEAAGAAARPGRTAGRGGGSGDMCGGRGGIWLVLAAALLHGNRSAALAVLPTAGSGEQAPAGWRAGERAGGRTGGPGLRLGGGAELFRGGVAAAL